MRSLSRVFLPRLRRSRQAEHRLAQAYQALFGGRGSAEDADIVLSDMANRSHYYKTHDLSRAKDVFNLDFIEGARAHFGGTLRYLNLSDEQAQALEKEARAEAITDATQGEF